MAEADYTDVSNVSPTAYRVLNEMGFGHGSITALEGRVEGLYRALDDRRDDRAEKHGIVDGGQPIMVMDGPLAIVSRNEGTGELYIRIGTLRDTPTVRRST